MSRPWESPDNFKWKWDAMKDQQDYFDLLGKRKWRKFKPSDYINLKRSIGFAIFGEPESVPGVLNGNTGYGENQLKHIEQIFGIIKELKKEHRDKDDIWVSFFFIVGKIDNVTVRIPVIRVPEFDMNNPRENNIFIDSCHRVYKGWQDYLDNNRLPECLLCYPSNGVYSAVKGNVKLEFGISPAGKIGKKVIFGFDIAGTVLGVAAAGVGITALFVPVALPFLIVGAAATITSGSYTVGRSIQTLVDRDQHRQSIGLDNAESRNCWLGIGGSVVGIASGGAVAAASKMAQAGESVALASQIAMKSVTASSCAINALGIVNGLTLIIEKAVDKEEITSLDVFQFATSILFFTNSVISTHQAHALINNIGEKGGTAGFMNNVMKQISSFEFQKEGSFSGPYIRGLSSFLSGSSSVMSSYITGELLGEALKTICKKFIEITKLLMQEIVTMAEYIAEVGTILHDWWELWNEEITDIVAQILKAFGVNHWTDIVVNGSRVLNGSGPNEIRELGAILNSERKKLLNNDTTTVASGEIQNNGDYDTTRNSASYETAAGTSGHNQVFPEDSALRDAPFTENVQDAELYTTNVAKIHSKFVELENCRTPSEFLMYMKFVCKFVREEFEKEVMDYNKTYEMVQNYCKNLSQQEFDKSNGIRGNRNHHFLEKTLNMFKDEKQKGFFKLMYAYECEKACSTAQENTAKTLVMDGTSIEPFCNKIGHASNGLLSKQQYYDMVAEYTKQHADETNVFIVEDGHTAVLQINDGESIMVVRSSLEDGKVSGIVAIYKK